MFPEATTGKASKRLLAVSLIYGLFGLAGTIHKYMVEELESTSGMTCLIGGCSGILGMIVFIAGRDVFIIEKWAKRNLEKI